MVDQRPHTATVTNTGEASKETNGDPKAGSTSTSEFRCRVEPNNRQGLVNTVDGKTVVYTWVVFADVETTELPVGTSISIKDKTGNEIANGTVIQFSKGQLNCRIWL